MTRVGASEGRVGNWSDATTGSVGSTAVRSATDLLQSFKRHDAAHDCQDDKDHNTNDGDDKESNVRLCHVINVLDRSGHRERSGDSLRQLEEGTVNEQVSNLSTGLSITGDSSTLGNRQIGKVVPASEESLWIVGDDTDVLENLVPAGSLETKEVEDVVVSGAVVVRHADRSSLLANLTNGTSADSLVGELGIFERLQDNFHTLNVLSSG